MTPSQAWSDYCVALRNVSKQEGLPWNVRWPIELGKEENLNAA